MKKKFYLLFLSVLISQSLIFAQQNCATLNSNNYSVCDNFLDADFTNNPTWQGNTADWIIENNQLKSNGPAVSGTLLYLTTPSSAALNTQWEFFANPKLSTSSNNYIDVFLISDTQDLSTQPNGYFVRIGDTKDEISLFRSDLGVETQIIDGTDGVIASTTNNPVYVKVIRSSDGTFTLYHNYNNAGVYTPEGSITDNTYNTASYFGVKIQYSSANNQKYLFDDFYAGNIILDTTAPTLNTINTINQTQLTIQFSEPIEINSAQNINNYILNGIIKPIAAILSPADLVTLTFANPFNSGNNTLQVLNIKDAANNTMPTYNGNFSYYLAQPFDVVINELFSDPSPSYGLPNYEFIELRNRTNLEISLLGWTVTDGADNAILPAVTLPANGYIIITSTNAGTAYNPFGLTVTIDNFPGLNNDGDAITLINNIGTTIDEITYTSNWYRNSDKADGGYTLERINANNLCASEANWIASENIIGGTPGAVNSVEGLYPDNTLPFIQSVKIIDPNTISVTFNEAADVTTAINATNYALNNGINVTFVEMDNTAFTYNIYLANPLAMGTIYTLTANNIKDCVGNIGNNLQIELAIPQPASAYDVLIDEIYADISVSESYPNPNLNLPNAEYLELYNASNKTFDLQNWWLSDATDTIILTNYLLLPKQYLILCSSSKVDSFKLNGYNNVLPMNGFGTLTDGGEPLTLIDNTGKIIHALTYSSSWYLDPVKSGGGYSLEMIDPNNPCSGASNWKASNAIIGGTPGAINSINGSNPDNLPPDLLRAEAVNPNLIVLYFSEPLDRTNAVAVNNYSIDNGIGSPISASIVSPGYNTVYLSTLNALQPNNYYNITVNNITDCIGNKIGLYNTDKFALSQPADSLDLIINEILPNPSSGGVDYVELYNRSSKVIDLSGWYIATTLLLENPDSIVDITQITPTLYSVLPGEYVVLTSNPSFVKSYYDNNKCGGSIPDNALFLTVNLPSFNDDLGTVLITNLMHTNILDKLQYNSLWHYPLLDTQDGVSLERINAAAATQDENNWHSAAATVCFGTPGYANSQNYDIPLTTDVFTINTEDGDATFSPDNDGFDDNIFFQFAIDNPDYTANLTIFDDRGRLVKHLVKNEILGNTQTFKWEGDNEEGGKALMGIYVVKMEIFNLTGEVKKYFKTCVLAQKLK